MVIFRAVVWATGNSRFRILDMPNSSVGQGEANVSPCESSLSGRASLAVFGKIQLTWTSMVLISKLRKPRVMIRRTNAIHIIHGCLDVGATSHKNTGSGNREALSKPDHFPAAPDSESV